MGQSLPFDPPRLSDTQLEILRRRIFDATVRMADDQILCLADSLHDALRDRRRARNRQVEDRLCAAADRPFLSRPRPLASSLSDSRGCRASAIPTY